MIFFFEFVYIVDYANGFSYIKPSLLPWDEAYLILAKNGFDGKKKAYSINGASLTDYLYVEK